MKKFIKITALSLFFIAFILVTTELFLNYNKYKKTLLDSNCIDINEIPKPAIYKNSTKKGIVLFGEPIFRKKYIKEEEALYTVLSKESGRNVYNLTFHDNYALKTFYLLKNNMNNSNMKTILNNDNIEHIIFFYQPGIVFSIFNCEKSNCIKLKTTKENTHLILSKNIIYNLEIYQTINRILLEKTIYTTYYDYFFFFKLYIENFRNEIKKILGKDIIFSIFVIDECGFEDWKYLKEIDFNIIKQNNIQETKKIKDYTNISKLIIKELKL